ncbi:hypothetical protein [Dulcicalothrix desertica]|uniref:hypothetical protein n=1 Tax=Dulcicalothrix desertica TaxID=32056 RepID=UPI000F8ED1E2|nr:hypothetical protein [Dulcicalothrix desertica]TWH43680.1 hypothetical protein CAL7102_07423 [Dulcicalothrix desertica PCC 7102]
MSTTSKQSIKSKLALIFASTTLAVSVAAPPASAVTATSTLLSQHYGVERPILVPQPDRRYSYSYKELL